MTQDWKPQHGGMSESPPERVSQPEPNLRKFGWHHAANKTLEEQSHAAHWEELPPPDKALLGPR